MVSLRSVVWVESQKLGDYETFGMRFVWSRSIERQLVEWNVEIYFNLQMINE